MSELLERFARVVRDTPDRVILAAPGEGRLLTCSDTRDGSRAASSALARAGLGRGDLIVSAVGNRAGFFPLFAACLEREVALMPLDRGTPAAEIRALAQRFGARALAAPAGATELLNAGAVELPAGLALELLSGRGDPAARVRAGDEAARYEGAAVLKVTSGSTGLPKATFTTAAQLLADGEAIVDAMDIRHADWQLGVIPISHSYGLGNLVVPLLAQGTALVLRAAFVPSTLVADAARHRARIFAGVPFMFEHLAAHLPDGAWPAPLETLISAGARLGPEPVRRMAARFGRLIHSFYGTSETGGIAYEAEPEPDGGSTVGHPLPGVTVALRPDERAPEGGGRIHVSGPAVARRYAGPADVDEDPFVDGGFLTGDLGAFDARGRLSLSGRVSAFVNVAGRKVQPEEVEAVLRAMPLVADARVVGAADPRRGEQLVACVVAREGATVPSVALRQYCAERLAPHKIPRTFVFVDALPRDARGKTSRRALDALVAAHLAAGER